MEIDLTDIPIGYTENYVDEYKLKSSKLIKDINSINSKMVKKYNYMIIPIYIYNIIEFDDRFKPSKINDIEVLRNVGSIGDVECYLDIYLPPDEIIMSWDKKTSRDVKLESILNGGIDEKEKRVKIIS
jgi:hypothetical protein